MRESDEPTSAAEQRRDLVFREEAEALREDLLTYVEADLADSRLKEAVLEVVSSGFRDVVGNTLNQQDLRRRLAGDLAQSMLTGLREAIPRLEGEALEPIRGALETRWAAALQDATRQTFEKVVEQRLVPQDLPEILRSVLAGVFKQRFPDLRQQAENVQQEQIEALRSDLEERWNSAVPGILKQSLEKAIGDHLKKEALNHQVEVIVSKRLEQIQVTAQNRLDLGQEISKGQQRQLADIRREIEGDWNRALPGLIKQGLSNALAAHFDQNALATAVDAAVTERFASLEESLQRGLKAADEKHRRLMSDREKDRERQIEEQLGKVIPGIVQTALENSLSQHLTEEKIQNRVESLVAPRFMKIDAFILDRWMKGAEAEQSQIDAVRQKIEAHWKTMLPVLVEASLQEALEKLKPETEKPNADLPIEKLEELPIPTILLPEVGTPGESQTEGAGGAQEASPDFWKRLQQKTAALSVRLRGRAGWAVAALIIVSLASLALWLKSSGFKHGGLLKERRANDSAVASNSAPAGFSFHGAWTSVLSPHAAKLQSYQRGLRGNDLDGTYQCWFGDKTPEALEIQLAQAKSGELHADLLVNAFPPCATNEAARRTAIVAALQAALGGASDRAAFTARCQPDDRQTMQDSKTSVAALNGTAGPATLGMTAAFLRCAGLDRALEIKAESSPTDLLFVVYAALREAVPADNKAAAQ
ncbi:MAG: hypothetical protein ABUT39_04430 [Acidobacteriota bacterium]